MLIYIIIIKTKAIIKSFTYELTYLKILWKLQQAQQKC